MGQVLVGAHDEQHLGVIFPVGLQGGADAGDGAVPVHVDKEAGVRIGGHDLLQRGQGMGVGGVVIKVVHRFVEDDLQPLFLQSPGKLPRRLQHPAGHPFAPALAPVVLAGVGAVDHGSDALFWRLWFGDDQQGLLLRGLRLLRRRLLRRDRLFRNGGQAGGTQQQLIDVGRVPQLRGGSARPQHGGKQQRQDQPQQAAGRQFYHGYFPFHFR